MRYSHLLWCLLLLGVASCRKALPINGARCTAGEANCVCDTQSGECFITGVNNPGGAGCTPLACDAIKATCGEFADPCTKKTLECGTCDTGQVCQYQRDANNKPSSSACIVGTQTTCQSLGYNCGSYTDPITNQVHDCTKEVNSGQACASGTSCGGGGQANVCGCSPLTCSDLNRVCGNHDGDGQPLQDGCGGFLNCDVQAGGCAAGKVCNFTAGACESTSCTPFTCDQLGNPCGPVSDGCGGQIACAAGACAAGSMCDPTAHKCLSLTTKPGGGNVTDPNNPIDSVACQGRGCGYALDACNVDHLCEGSLAACCPNPPPPGLPLNDGANCTNGEACIANQCELNPTSSAACPPGRCGTNVKDPLGKVISACNAAVCQGGQLCEPTTGFCMDPGATTCIAQGRNCGKIYYVDAGGGDHNIDCGDTCPVEPGFETSFSSGSFYNEVCGGSGSPGVCALPHAPTVCVEQNAHCGYAADACGNKYLCGACALGNKCAIDPTVNAPDCQACKPGPVESGGDHFDCSSPAYLNTCGTNLDDNCAGTINCGCPDDNTSGAFGAPYKKSTGTVVCTAPDKSAGTCACTADPNACKNANACNTTIPDDGCGRPVACGTCQAVEGDPTTTVCEADNNKCCAADASICATSCAPIAKNECNNQITIDCQKNLTTIGANPPVAVNPPGCTTTTLPSGETGEIFCASPCSGNTKGAGACEGSGNSWACCGNNTVYSTDSSRCCDTATEVLSNCADANTATDCSGNGLSCTCQTTAKGLCCEPWTCATYATAHPESLNSFYAGATLPDGCGGTIAAACNYCDTTDHFGTGGAGTNDTIGGTCCQCQPKTAADCGGNCNETLTARVCTPPGGASTVEAPACNNATVETSTTFTCNVGNVCPGGDVCDGGNACCVPCGANECNDSKCGTACTCASGSCNTTNNTCCASGKISSAGVCCTGTQVLAGPVGAKVCCASGQATGDGLLCCPGGEVAEASSCCTNSTCPSIGDGQACGNLPNTCGGTISCTNCAVNGETCTGGHCTCPTPVCPAGQCSGNATNACGGLTGCNAACEPGQTTCGADHFCHCTTCTASGTCACPAGSGESCVSGTCVCEPPTCPAGQCSGKATAPCGAQTSCNAACAGGTVCSPSSNQCCSAGQVIFNNACCTPKGQPNDCPCGNTWTDQCGGPPEACDTCGSSGG